MNTLIALLLLNDGYLDSGEGPARLGKSESNVRMVSEDIRLLVGKGVVETTCEFRFRNEGRATTVRMGFPNNIDNMEAEDFETKPLKPILEEFRTWVDGRPVRAHLIRAAANDENWSYFTKSVKFSAHQSRRVRVTYWTTIGAQAVLKGYQNVAGYIISSGKGWKDTIGHATIRATFLPSSGLQTPVRAFRGDAAPYPMPVGRAKMIDDPHVVWVSSPGTVRVKGRTIIFEAREIEPEKTDNVFLSWGHEMVNS